MFGNIVEWWTNGLENIEKKCISTQRIVYNPRLNAEVLILTKSTEIESYESKFHYSTQKITESWQRIR